ncbi:hypothetical protein ACHWQZ_G003564 [Mnemiopsis leidyi]
MYLLIVLLLLLLGKSSSLDNKYNALHFGTTNDDYISYTRDMSPFRDALTICMWIKRVDTSTPSPAVFHYYTSSSTYEILIASEGEYNRVVDDQVLENSNSYFQTPVGQWFSYCLTWSRTTNIIRLYLNGLLVKSGTTSSGNWRQLYTSGTLWFNRLGDRTDSSCCIFGGQLFGFNMFSEVLSAETIRKIGEGGLCYDIDEISSVPVLKWEEVVAKSRSGNVREVHCEIERLTSELNRTKTNLDSVTSELNTTRTNLDSVTNELNTTQKNLDSVLTQLTQTQDELETIREKLNRTEVSLETCNSTLLDKADHLDLTTEKLEKRKNI